MRGVIVNPWECPAGDSVLYRLVSLSNLPPGQSAQSVLKQKLADYRIEYTHFFGRQALIQFADPLKARQFVAENCNSLTIDGYPVTVALSPLEQLQIPQSEATFHMPPSRVICIQVMKLRVCLGIQDIYDECSHFGIVEKIICFEKNGWFALVQMETVNQACLVRANLTNAARHLPAFQFRIQYSRNSDIVIKFNNWKSFDFTVPDAAAQFARLREQAVHAPFFMVEESQNIPRIFDVWRPVHFDPEFSSVLSVTGYDESRVTCDVLRNLCSQYGPVVKVRFAFKHKWIAYVQFANCLYARLAFVYLQGCSLFERRLVFEFLMQSDVHSIEFGEDQVSTYDSEQEDFEIGDYQQLYFQSNCLLVRNVNVKDIPVPDGAKIDPARQRIVFSNIEAATEFLVMKNWTRIGDTPVLMSFANPNQ